MQSSLGYYHMYMGAHVYGACGCVPPCACESQGLVFGVDSVPLPWVGLNSDHLTCSSSTIYLLSSAPGPAFSISAVAIAVTHLLKLEAGKPQTPLVLAHV